MRLSDKELRDTMAKEYGWEDVSWDNDACDSMELRGGRPESENALYTLWIEAADWDMRETEGARYTLVRNDPFHSDSEVIFSTESQGAMLYEIDAIDCKLASVGRE